MRVKNLKIVLCLSFLALISWGMFRVEAPPQFLYQFVSFLDADIFLHTSALFGFTVLAVWAFSEYVRVLSFWIVVLFIAMAFEPLQHVINARRNFTIEDFLSNVLGVVLGGIFIFTFVYVKNFIACKK